ncbi:acyl-CoA desaturase [Actinobacteria bacterium YIM 96077]|uniref:Acyl-CoA desaturase n=1 Tax=Phytoactinopolyspora halophila TaxID=1981511 RepID=A0A329QC39_9ACTN|nr:acyl-CoA desaturase [Phytoactinopolyspora halophila]AYY14121.1 acyl-CoA desaturase [Actinobacteria bacterium YIM 96077]RAW09943.1 acyl-CoA desaturase [Phytoactinopolyspora halophila]
MNTETSTLTRHSDRPAEAPRKKYVSAYSELLTSVRDAGLLRRRPGYYAVRVAVLAALLAGCGVAFAVLGESWWQLAVAGAFGLLLSQVAYLSHDAAHRQIFTSGKLNEWSALILGNAIVGLSYGWWMSKHSRHHANPNKVGADPDVVDGALVFTADAAMRRRWRRGFAGWFVARQGTLFFPLLLLAGLNLHVASVRTVFGRGRVKHRAVEIPVLLARLSLYPLVLFTVLSPGLAAAFLAVQLGVFGFSMGATFAPNHKGMPVLAADMNIDFLQRQVRTSRNVRGSWFVDVAMGGLNYQIEHHLFPSMPRPNLRKAQPLVRQYCATHGIPYIETGMLESWGIVVRHLNEVGVGDLDPFQCPLAAQLRAVN